MKISLKERLYFPLRKKIKILKGKFSISSFPNLRVFLLDCLVLEYYLHRLLLLQIIQLTVIILFTFSLSLRLTRK